MMLKIDSEKLRDYMDDHKKLIGVNKFNSLCEIISGLSLFITIITTSLPVVMQIIGYIISAIITIIGICQMIIAFSIDGNYNDERAYREICELDENKTNIFDIILFQNSNQNGKYLLYKNVRWKCNLFLNYRFTEDPAKYDSSEEIKRITPLLENTLGINSSDLKLHYMGTMTSRKYCVTEKYNKKYDFHFYKLDSIKNYYNNVNKFEYNGKHLCWMTLDEMYSNRRIRKRNFDVLDYIRDSGENIA